MKIIDEKGRLFGKLNIIDALVLLLIVAAAAVLALRLLNRNSGADPGASDAATQITYTVLVTEVSPESYEAIRQFVDPEAGKKDALVSNSKVLNAYVTDCQASPHVTYVEAADGQVYAAQSTGGDQRLDLVFTIQAAISETVDNKVGSQDVRIGVRHIVKTAHFEFSSGTVLTVNWENGGN